jgi:RNA ligase
MEFKATDKWYKDAAKSEEGHNISAGAEFKTFPKIQPIGKLYMTITQKLHGTNAQILIEEYPNQVIMSVGSRTRWLSLDDDNYGFARWAYENQAQLVEKLGLGRHFGEWCGAGINNGEGLTEKTLCLFNHQRWAGKDLPKNVTTVPVLYHGKCDINKVDAVMNDLREQGSRLVPGFMHPEGVVIEVGGEFYKRVFDPEDTKWVNKREPKIRVPRETIDVSHLLQPLRLQKLLSRDERYTREYPETLRDIANDYIHDLLSESNEYKEPGDTQLMKELTRQVFLFVKQVMRTV